MARVLVLYYSSYGHIERMALAEADGARGAGADVDVKRVPELVPRKVAFAAHYKLDQIAPVAQIDDLANYDAIVFGTPTRFGNMAAPLKYFLDCTSSLWLSGALAGKPAGVFTSTQSMHGGQETTLLSMMMPLIHHGMYLVGIPYTERALNETRFGGSPYGASHVAGMQDDPVLADHEKTLAQALGRRVAALAERLRTP